jgi:two-component system, NtrC family, response regulator AtoC
MKSRIKVLIVDDEAIVRESLRDWLTDTGYTVLTAETGMQALEIIRKEKPGVALIDLVLNGPDGLDVLRKCKQISPATQSVLITAYGNVQSAVMAMKEGAYDYIEKPFSPQRIEQIIAEIVERRGLNEVDNINLPRIEEKYIFENMVAKSQRMQKIVEMIKVVANSNVPVLISGESGTGKETVARAIHSLSPRSFRPFVTISCAHLPETLIESELFGHENGVAGGGQNLRKGKFEVAVGGTLFLDEVGNLDPNVQAHLLRALEEKSFSRVGGNEVIQAEIRLVSGTSKDLKRASEAGDFREDLYYRLSVVNIDLPPLRERKEDIPLLAEYFLAKFNEENQKQVAGLSEEARNFILSYDWPGNIWELENAIERAVILAKGGRIEGDDLSQQGMSLPPKTALGKTMRDIEKGHILNILIEAKGNCSEAARLLGISRMTLYNKIKSYGLDVNKIAPK